MDILPLHQTCRANQSAQTQASTFTMVCQNIGERAIFGHQLGIFQMDINALRVFMFISTKNW